MKTKQSVALANAMHMYLQNHVLNKRITNKTKTAPLQMPFQHMYTA